MRPDVVHPDGAVPPHDLAAERAAVVESVSSPATWASSDHVVAAAVALLPELDDDLVADVVEALTLALVEARECIHATRTSLSVVLAAAHQQQREITRLRARLRELLDERRRLAA